MTANKSSSDHQRGPRGWQRHWLWALLASNGVLLVALIAVMIHYRVPHKAWRRLFVEQRVVGFSQDHELNRNYRDYREIFSIYPERPVSVLVLGDSQVQRVSWSELLSRPDVVGRGIPGDTVQGLRSRLVDEHATAPVVVVVMIGTNDVLNGSAADTAIQEMMGLVADVQRLWPNATLTLVDVPPVAAWVESNHERNARIAKVNGWMANEATGSARLRHIDLATSLTDSSGNLAPTMTSDGIHLSAAAYGLIRERLQSHLPASK
jgi:lysophospholipase L1-like esterase